MAPTTTDRDRKQLLRCLIEEVVLDVTREQRRATLTLRWRGGAITELSVPLPRERRECRAEPVSTYMTTEHIDVGADFSDAEVAEIFLHHRVLIVPVVDGRRVVGVITRSDFFHSVAERFLAR